MNGRKEQAAEMLSLADSGRFPSNKSSYTHKKMQPPQYGLFPII